ncbi:MAG: phosphotransferase [Candidatus Omnitrophica bacterium]|nr:phosphotransferase [Candidatus Omnitrophota bacterium]
MADITEGSLIKELILQAAQTKGWNVNTEDIIVEDASRNTRDNLLNIVGKLADLRQVIGKNNLQIVLIQRPDQQLRTKVAFTAVFSNEIRAGRMKVISYTLPIQRAMSATELIKELWKSLLYTQKEPETVFSAQAKVDALAAVPAQAWTSAGTLFSNMNKNARSILARELIQTMNKEGLEREALLKNLPVAAKIFVKKILSQDKTTRGKAPGPVPVGSPGGEQKVINIQNAQPGVGPETVQMIRKTEEQSQPAPETPAAAVAQQILNNIHNLAPPVLEGDKFVLTLSQEKVEEPLQAAVAEILKDSIEIKVQKQDGSTAVIPADQITIRFASVHVDIAKDAFEGVDKVEITIKTASGQKIFDLYWLTEEALIQHMIKAFGLGQEDTAQRTFQEVGASRMYQAYRIPVVTTDKGRFAIKRYNPSKVRDFSQGIFITEAVVHLKNNGIPVPTVAKAQTTGLNVKDYYEYLNYQGGSLFFTIENWIEGGKEVSVHDATLPMIFEAGRILARIQKVLAKAPFRDPHQGTLFRLEKAVQDITNFNWKDHFRGELTDEEIVNLVKFAEDVKTIPDFLRGLPQQIIASDLNFGNMRFDPINGKVVTIFDWDNIRESRRLEDTFSVIYHTGKSGYYMGPEASERLKALLSGMRDEGVEFSKDELRGLYYQHIIETLINGMLLAGAPTHFLRSERPFNAKPAVAMIQYALKLKNELNWLLEPVVGPNSLADVQGDKNPLEQIKSIVSNIAASGRRVVVVADKDRTLTASHTLLDEPMALAIIDLIKAGGIFALASGSDLERLEREFLGPLRRALSNEDKTKAHFIYVICNNGAAMIKADLLTGSMQEVYSVDLNRKFGPGTVERVEEILRDFVEQEPELKALKDIRIKVRPNGVDFQILGDINDDQMRRSFDPDRVKRDIWKEKIQQILDREGIPLIVKVTGTASINILDAATHKGYGIAQLIKELQAQMSDVVYLGDEFGDRGNDSEALIQGIGSVVNFGKDESVGPMVNYPIKGPLGAMEVLSAITGILKSPADSQRNAVETRGPPKDPFYILTVAQGRALVSRWIQIYSNENRAGGETQINSILEFLAERANRQGDYINETLRKFPILEEMHRIFTQATLPDGKSPAFELPAVKGKTDLFGSLMNGPNLLDVGAGMAILAERCLNIYSGITHAVSADIELQRIVPFIVPSGKTHELKLMSNPMVIPVQDEWANTVTSTFVLHHLEVDRPAYLREIRRTMAPGSRLIVLEDTFSDVLCEQPADSDWRAGEVSKMFLGLKFNEEKLGFLHFADWFIHNFVNRSRTPLVPGNYETMETWRKMFEEAGFVIQQERNLGFSALGSRNPVSRGLFILQKSGEPVNPVPAMVPAALPELKEAMGQGRLEEFVEEQVHRELRSILGQGDLPPPAELLKALIALHKGQKINPLTLEVEDLTADDITILDHLMHRVHEALTSSVERSVAEKRALNLWVEHDVKALTGQAHAQPAEAFTVPQSLLSSRHPLPTSVRHDSQGRIYAFWAMAFGLAEWFLERQKENRLPVLLDRQATVEIAKYLDDAYGLTNVERSGTGISVRDIVNYLEEIGLVRRENGGLYALAASPEALATWARRNVYIEKDLAAFFNARGGIKDEDALLKKIAVYEQEAGLNATSLVESRQAFLRAVLGLSVQQRRSLVKLFQHRYFDGEKAPRTGGTMVDSVLLMLRAIKDLAGWARILFPLLTKGGRRLYLVAAEITLLSGGLGRVMQYLGRALYKFGLKPVFIEPHYLRKIIRVPQDQLNNYEGCPVNEIVNGIAHIEVPLDYTQLTLPLDPQRVPELDFEITVQGQREKVLVYHDINDEGIPVYTFRDERGFYIQVLYYYVGGRHPTAFQAIEFITKAASKLIDVLEEAERRSTEAQEKEWVAPVIALNDGQSVLSAAWPLFYGELQTEVLLNAHYMVTTHTVRNTIEANDHEFLKRAGVPDGWMWIFKRRSLWGNGPTYDLTKAGIMAVQMFGGFANGVSDSHAATMRRFFPQIGRALNGVTNGDLINLTMREFSMAFMDMVTAHELPAGVKEAYTALQEKKAAAEVHHKAFVQREMDELANNALWTWAMDTPGRNGQDVRDMFVRIQSKMKKDYLQRFVKPQLAALGLAVPERFNGNTDAFMDYLLTLPWTGYSGRWVEEKAGRSRAHSYDVLRRGLEYGIFYVVLGNEQSNEKSRQLVHEMRTDAQDLNNKDLAGKIVFKSSFALDEQVLLLMALDMQMQDSDMENGTDPVIITGAAESTESETWMHAGSVALHGFIQLIKAPLNRLARRGANPVIMDEGKDSYARLYKWLKDVHTSGEIINYHMDGFYHFRTTDVIITAAAYARAWEAAVRENEAFRLQLTAKTGKSVAESLKQYYSRYAREEREVALHSIETYALEGTVRIPLEHANSGRDTVFFSAPSKTKEKVIVRALVDPQGVPEARIVAFARGWTGVWVELKNVGHQENLLVFEGAWSRRTSADEGFEVVATSGMWEETGKVRLTSLLSPAEKEAVKQQADKNMEIIVRGGEKVDESTYRFGDNVPVSMIVKVPFTRRDLVHRVRLFAFVQEGDSDAWHMMEPARMTMETSWVNGAYLEFNVSFPAVRDMRVTFGLAPLTDEPVDLGKDVLAWANGESKDLKIVVVHTYSPYGHSVMPALAPAVLPELKRVLTEDNRESQSVLQQGDLPPPLDRTLLLNRIKGSAFPFVYWTPEIGLTVVAGMPHFDHRNGAPYYNWGRDTMIALPGLCLNTGNFPQFRQVFKNYLSFVKDGLMPNLIGDGEAPRYNSVDATFWMFRTLGRYLEATGDYAFLDEPVDMRSAKAGVTSMTVLEILENVMARLRSTAGIVCLDEWGAANDRHSQEIRVRQDSDHLISAGNATQNLTWMDAQPQGALPVTSRHGKAVEINELWYHALEMMSGIMEQRKRQQEAGEYRGLAKQVKASFRAKFINPATGGLYDVIDGDPAQMRQVRPSQVLAMAGLLTRPEARRALAVVREELLTPFGLRTLSPKDPAYQGTHTRETNEYSYHQGTVWPWLMAGFTEACVYAYGLDEARRILENIEVKLWDKTKQSWDVKDAGSWFDAIQTWQNDDGRSPEILNGDALQAAHYNRAGCERQAWTLGACIESVNRIYPPSDTAEEHERAAFVKNGPWYQIVTKDFKSQDAGVKNFDFIREQALPRLAAKGVKLIWLMGYGLSDKGSSEPFAVLDPLTVEPSFGGEEALRRLLARAHELGIKVIGDFIANHVSKNSPLVKQHPDWFIRDAGGKLVDATDMRGAWGWTNLAQFNFLEPQVPAYLASVAHKMLDMGFDGLRLDAPKGLLKSRMKSNWFSDRPQEVDRLYPEEFWKMLIRQMRRDFPGALFVAELLSFGPERDIMEACGIDFGMDIWMSSLLFDVLHKGLAPENFRNHLEWRLFTAFNKPSVLLTDGHDIRDPDHRDMDWGMERLRLLSGEEIRFMVTLFCALPDPTMFFNGQIEAVLNYVYDHARSSSIAWETYDPKMRAFYDHAAAFAQLPVLRHGTAQMVYPKPGCGNPNVISFARRLGDEVVVVAAHIGQAGNKEGGRTWVKLDVDDLVNKKGTYTVEDLWSSQRFASQEAAFLKNEGLYVELGRRGIQALRLSPVKSPSPADGSFTGKVGRDEAQKIVDQTNKKKIKTVEDHRILAAAAQAWTYINQLKNSGEPRAPPAVKKINSRQVSFGAFYSERDHTVYFEVTFLQKILKADIRKLKRIPGLENREMSGNKTVLLTQVFVHEFNDGSHEENVRAEEAYLKTTTVEAPKTPANSAYGTDHNRVEAPGIGHAVIVRPNYDHFEIWCNYGLADDPRAQMRSHAEISTWNVILEKLDDPAMQKIVGTLVSYLGREHDKHLYNAMFWIKVLVDRGEITGQDRKALLEIYENRYRLREDEVEEELAGLEAAKKWMLQQVTGSSKVIQAERDMIELVAMEVENSLKDKNTAVKYAAPYLLYLKIERLQRVVPKDFNKIPEKDRKVFVAMIDIFIKSVEMMEVLKRRRFLADRDTPARALAAMKEDEIARLNLALEKARTQLPVTHEEIWGHIYRHTTDYILQKGHQVGYAMFKAVNKVKKDHEVDQETERFLSRVLVLIDREFVSKNSPSLNKEDYPSVVVIFGNITPSKIKEILRRYKVTGVISDFGSAISHLGEELNNNNVPGIFGVPTEFMEKIKEGASLAVIPVRKAAGQLEAYNRIIVNPDFNEISEVIKAINQARSEEIFYLQQPLDYTYSLPDGGKILVKVAADEAGEMKASFSSERSPAGVGLARTESLFLWQSPELPSLDMVAQSMSELTAVSRGNTVRVRTVDRQPDKKFVYAGDLPYDNAHTGFNFYRTEPGEKLLALQLQAASLVFQKDHHLGLIIPMVSTVEDVQYLFQVIGELKTQGIDLKGIAVSLMIENIQAVDNINVILREAKRAAFGFGIKIEVNVGLNDLTKSVLSVDRDDKSISQKITGIVPGVARRIILVAKACASSKVPVCLCGSGASSEGIWVLAVVLTKMVPGLVLSLAVSGGRAAKAAYYLNEFVLLGAGKLVRKGPFKDLFSVHKPLPKAEDLNRKVNRWTTETQEKVFNSPQIRQIMVKFQEIDKGKAGLPSARRILGWVPCLPVLVYHFGWAAGALLRSDYYIIRAFIKTYGPGRGLFKLALRLGVAFRADDFEHSPVLARLPDLQRHAVIAHETAHRYGYASETKAYLVEAKLLLEEFMAPLQTVKDIMQNQVASILNEARLKALAPREVTLTYDHKIPYTVFYVAPDVLAINLKLLKNDGTLNTLRFMFLYHIILNYLENTPDNLISRQVQAGQRISDRYFSAAAFNGDVIKGPSKGMLEDRLKKVLAERVSYRLSFDRELRDIGIALRNEGSWRRIRGKPVAKVILEIAARAAIAEATGYPAGKDENLKNLLGYVTDAQDREYLARLKEEFKKFYLSIELNNQFSLWEISGEEFQKLNPLAKLPYVYSYAGVGIIPAGLSAPMRMALKAAGIIQDKYLRLLAEMPSIVYGWAAMDKEDLFALNAIKAVLRTMGVNDEAQVDRIAGNIWEGQWDNILLQKDASRHNSKIKPGPEIVPFKTAEQLRETWEHYFKTDKTPSERAEDFYRFYKNIIDAILNRTFTMDLYKGMFEENIDVLEEFRSRPEAGLRGLDGSHVKNILGQILSARPYEPPYAGIFFFKYIHGGLSIFDIFPTDSYLNNIHYTLRGVIEKAHEGKYQMLFQAYDTRMRDLFLVQHGWSLYPGKDYEQLSNEEKLYVDTIYQAVSKNEVQKANQRLRAGGMPPETKVVVMYKTMEEENGKLAEKTFIEKELSLGDWARSLTNKEVVYPPHFDPQYVPASQVFINNEELFRYVFIISKQGFGMEVSREEAALVRAVEDKESFVEMKKMLHIPSREELSSNIREGRPLHNRTDVSPALRARSAKEQTKFESSLKSLQDLKHPVQVLFVVPMYKEMKRLSPQGEDALRMKVEQLIYLKQNNLFFDGRLLFIDDGTPEMASRKAVEALWKSLRAEYAAQGVVLAENMVEVMEVSPDEKKATASRKGYAVKKAMAKAVQDGWAQYIGYTDLDVSTNLLQTPLLLAPLVSGRYGAAIGSRYAPDAESQGTSMERVKSSHQYLTAVHTLLPLLRGISDTQRGFKLFDRDLLAFILERSKDRTAFKYAKDPGLSFDTELLLLTKLARAEITEVPIAWFDSAEESTINLGKDAYKMLWGVVKQAWLWINPLTVLHLRKFRRPGVDRRGKDHSVLTLFVLPAGFAGLSAHNAQAGVLASIFPLSWFEIQLCMVIGLYVVTTTLIVGTYYIWISFQEPQAAWAKFLIRIWTWLSKLFSKKPTDRSFDGNNDPVGIRQRQQIVEEAGKKGLVRPVAKEELGKVYDYLLKHGLKKAASWIDHLNSGTDGRKLNAWIVGADIGGGFIGDDGGIYVQPSYRIKGIPYQMEDIFFHEFLARLGLPHELNEHLTLRFRNNGSIPDFVLKTFERRLSSKTLPPVSLLSDRTMGPGKKVTGHEQRYKNLPNSKESMLAMAITTYKLDYEAFRGQVDEIYTELKERRWLLSAQENIRGVIRTLEENSFELTAAQSGQIQKVLASILAEMVKPGASLRVEEKQTAQANLNKALDGVRAGGLFLTGVRQLLVSVNKTLDARRESTESIARGIIRGRLRKRENRINRRNAGLKWRLDEINRLSQLRSYTRAKKHLLGALALKEVKGEPDLEGPVGSEYHGYLRKAQSALENKQWNEVGLQLKPVYALIDRSNALYRAWSAYALRLVDEEIRSSVEVNRAGVLEKEFGAPLQSARERALWWARLYQAVFIPLNVNDPQHPGKRVSNQVFKAANMYRYVVAIDTIAETLAKRNIKSHKPVKEFLATRRYKHLIREDLAPLARTIAQDFGLNEEQTILLLGIVRAEKRTPGPGVLGLMYDEEDARLAGLLNSRQKGARDEAKELIKKAVAREEARLVRPDGSRRSRLWFLFRHWRALVYDQAIDEWRWTFILFAPHPFKTIIKLWKLASRINAVYYQSGLARAVEVHQVFDEAAINKPYLSRPPVVLGLAWKSRTGILALPGGRIFKAAAGKKEAPDKKKDDKKKQEEKIIDLILALLLLLLLLLFLVLPFIGPVAVRSGWPAWALGLWAVFPWKAFAWPGLCLPAALPVAFKKAGIAGTGPAVININWAVQEVFPAAILFIQPAFPSAAWINGLWWWGNWSQAFWFWQDLYWLFFNWMYWPVVTVCVTVVKFMIRVFEKQICLDIVGLVKGGLAWILNEMYLTVFTYDVEVISTTYQYTVRV